MPREIETCTVDLLQATAREAASRRLPVAIDAAYNILEFFDIIREHQMTSIELLEQLGLMSDTLNIGHGNFVAENPLMNYSGGHDLRSWVRIDAPSRTARSMSRGARAISAIPGSVTARPASTSLSVLTPIRAT